MKLLRTAALALALLAPLSPAAAGPAADHITAMSAQAITALQTSGSTLAKREKALRPVLREGFDMGRIARFVAGRYWKRATPEQQKEYTQVFSEYVLATYARRLGGYAGEDLKVLAEKPAGPKDVLVKTQIVSGSGGPAIDAEWRVRTGDAAGPKVIDVLVEGVSMAVTQRQDFSSVIRRDGFDGLINVLRARAGRQGVRQ
jgi:phospholipid transport system substrate-binding protein